MNILIVANHYAVCSARYAADAFTRLGHTVRHVGPAQWNHIWGLTLPKGYTWLPDSLLTSDGQPFLADLAIIMDSDPALLDSVEKWAIAPHAPRIIWGVDNHVRDYRRPYFEHYFLAHHHHDVSVMEWGQGTLPELPPIVWYPDMTHLPCAYDPTLHTPSPIPFEDRDYDVAMIGVMYPQRWAIVKALREAGVKVLAGCGLVYDSYVAAYHNARISLCLSVAGDVAQRVFETAAMGCVVMSDACPDYQLLKPDGFWLLDDTEPETVVQAVKDVLHEPDRAQVMIEHSMAWVKPHTWDARAQRVVDWYETQRATMPSVEVDQ